MNSARLLLIVGGLFSYPGLIFLSEWWVERRGFAGSIMFAGESLVRIKPRRLKDWTVTEAESCLLTCACRRIGLRPCISASGRMVLEEIWNPDHIPSLCCHVACCAPSIIAVLSVCHMIMSFFDREAIFTITYLQLCRANKKKLMTARSVVDYLWLQGEMPVLCSCLAISKDRCSGRSWP